MKKSEIMTELRARGILFEERQSVLELKALLGKAKGTTSRKTTMSLKSDPMASLDRLTKSVLVSLAVGLQVLLGMDDKKGDILIKIRSRLRSMETEGVSFGKYKDVCYPEAAADTEYALWILDQEMKCPGGKMLQTYIKIAYKGLLKDASSEEPSTKVEKEEMKRESKDFSIPSKTKAEFKNSEDEQEVKAPARVKVEKMEKLPKDKKLDPVMIPIHTSSESEEDRSHKKKAVRPEDLPEDSTSAQSWMELGEKRKNRPSKARSSRG